MVDTLIIPVLVTTDLPPGTDLAEFGRLVADAAAALPGDRGVPYPGYLSGAAFWLDQPGPARPPGGVTLADHLRFAAILGHLSTREPRPPRTILADARAAITSAVSGRYGDLGSPPAVLAITSEDVRVRTPDTAVPAATRQGLPELAAAARSYL
ncbi:hypothetical protein [Sphaerisporangium corydalis]|uniref:Uncharacterized protein n=1 Tax=Sphaerisporangium corydalis TaxID=1441875 RepID=A0ABV9EPQ6_9ACTN|nr:hypothetical protein [Sphaerisporangium corydalis]